MVSPCCFLRQWNSGRSLLGVCIACHNLDPVNWALDWPLRVAEVHILHHEGPHIVTEAVGAQLLGLEGHFVPGPLRQGLVDAFVECGHHSGSQLLRNYSVGHHVVQRILQCLPNRGRPVHLICHLCQIIIVVPRDVIF